jgi:hypothetical protein
MPMPTLDLSVPHHLTKDDALSRIKKFSESMKTKYSGQVEDFHDEWQGYRGSFNLKIMGFALSGEIEATDSEVNFTARYPFMAAPFKSRVEEKLREIAENLLA